jgi:hypothetical protein
MWNSTLRIDNGGLHLSDEHSGKNWEKIMGSLGENILNLKNHIWGNPFGGSILGGKVGGHNGRTPWEAPSGDLPRGTTLEGIPLG